MHRIIITPTLDIKGRPKRSSKGPLFNATYEGQVIVIGSTEPLLDGARALKAMGLSGRIEMWDTVLPYARMTADIDKAAGLRVVEGEEPPRFRKWDAFPAGRVQDGHFAAGGNEVAQTGDGRPTDSPCTPVGQILAGQ